MKHLTMRPVRRVAGLVGIGLCLFAIAACDRPPDPSDTAREKRARVAAQRERFIAGIANRFGAKMSLEADWKADSDSDQVLTHVMQERVKRWHETQLLFLQLDDILMDGDTVRILARKGDMFATTWLFELRCRVGTIDSLPTRTDAESVRSGFGDEFLVVADSLRLDLSARSVYQYVRGPGESDEAELRYLPPTRIVGVCKALQRFPKWLDE
jgi:hypothetical protein